jgi:peptide deformylase
MEYVKPHTKLSREVTEQDLPAVIEAVEHMRGAFENKTCVALAHPQVANFEPLKIYVTREGGVFINPVIKRHSNYTVDSREGCMTFLGREAVIKQRWQKAEVEYQTLEGGKLSELRTVNLSGLPAFIAQHEIDHLNGKYCYE